MKENIINLKFRGTLTDLSGNRLGDEVYVAQISKKIDIGKKI